MKIILFIYLAVSIITLLISYLIALDAFIELKKRYPDIVKPPISFTQKVINLIRVVVTSFCPIVNIILLLSFLLFWDKVKEQIIEDIVIKWGV